MPEAETEGSFLEMWFAPDFSGRKGDPFRLHPGTGGAGHTWELSPARNWMTWASDEVRQSLKGS